MKKLFCCFFAVVLVVNFTGCDINEYKSAMNMYENGQYEEAGSAFLQLGNYRDSSEMAKECSYIMANNYLESGDYELAADVFEKLADYKDSSEKKDTAQNELMYQTYHDVIDSIKGKSWFFNAGSDLKVGNIQFSKSGREAAIKIVSIDSNGMHDIKNTNYSCYFDDKNIRLEASTGEPTNIPYICSNNTIKIGNGEYFSNAEVISGLQGYWSYSISSPTSQETNIYINNNTVTYESAAISYFSQDYYYYYGPYIAAFSLDNYPHLKNNNNTSGMAFLHFNIINGKVNLIVYSHICKRSNGLPGENGYEF